MLTGSFVSSYYGDPRTTGDLDLIVNAQEPPVDAMKQFRGSVFGRRVLRFGTIRPWPNFCRSTTVQRYFRYFRLESRSDVDTRSALFRQRVFSANRNLHSWD